MANKELIRFLKKHRKELNFSLIEQAANIPPSTISQVLRVKQGRDLSEDQEKAIHKYLFNFLVSLQKYLSKNYE